MGIASGFLCAYTILLVLNIPLVQQPQLFAFLGPAIAGMQGEPKDSAALDGARVVLNLFRLFRHSHHRQRREEETTKNYQRRILNSYCHPKARPRRSSM
ncbi:hypothetical protein B0H11DRAFT_1984336 [Mycena galericulata]|nr:hypothetical protein B0H11DRAFT_1984336 [Mycena galericulata]